MGSTSGPRIQSNRMPIASAFLPTGACHESSESLKVDLMEIYHNMRKEH